MTTYSEYLDWSGLHPGDPVPGHVSDIRAVARRVDEVAETIRAAVTALNNAGDTAQAISDAVRTQQDRINEAKDNLSKVDERYATTASELRAYADKLDDWQVSAGTLHGQGRDAEHAVSTAQGNVNWADQCSFQALTSLNNASDDAPFKLNALKTSSDNAKSDYNKACTALSDARGNLEAIKKQLVDLHEKWNSGSEDTARNIRDGADADGQNNSVGSWISNKWEGFCDFVEAAAQIVHQIAGAIAGIAGVLALVFAWCPVVSAIFVAIALVAGVIDLVAQLINYTNGHASLGEVVLAAVGVAAGGIATGVAGLVKGANAARGALSTAEATATAASSASRASTAASTVAREATNTAGDVARLAGRTNAAANAADASPQAIAAQRNLAAAQARITIPWSIFKESWAKPFRDVGEAVASRGQNASKPWTDFTPFVKDIKGDAQQFAAVGERLSLGQQFVGSQGLALQISNQGLVIGQLPTTLTTAWDSTIGTAFGSHYWENWGAINKDHPSQATIAASYSK